MKIIQLATSDQGGAGIAAKRTNDCLRLAGVESTLVTRDQNNVYSKVNLPKQIKQKVQSLKSSALTVMQSKAIQAGADLVTPLSLNTLDYEKLLKENFDILHIHAFYNFLNIKSISDLANLGIPIFITLHDQRLITGGCHYSRNCSQYQRGCNSCPQTRKIFNPIVSSTFNSQERLLKEHSNIELISPSAWLANLCMDSVIARNRKVQIVHNPVPDKYFQNSVSNYARNNRRYIGFAAANLNNPYKDLNVFVKAVNELNKKSNERISVHLIGEGAAPDFSPDIEVSRAAPKSDSGMIEELKKIRTLVVPSNQDNSPSVISEALAMGIPVIGSNVGGIPEMLRDFQLPIFEPGNYLQLALLLNESIPLSTTSEITSVASRKFSEKIIAQQLLKIYSSRS